jgi:hypothetical protein
MLLVTALVSALAASPRWVELHVGRCAQCTHATIDSARDAVRALRARRQQLGQQQQPAGGVRVVVHEGIYSPLVLDAQLDSGRAGSPTEYVGYNLDGEAVPVVSAGLEVPKSSWRPAPGKPPGVLVADLTELGLSADDLGQLPQNGNARGEADWIEPRASVWWGTICEQRNASNQKAMLFHQGAVGTVGAHLARFPNLDQPSGHWKWLHGIGRAAATGRDSSGKAATLGMELNVTDSARVQSWVASEEAAFIHGYWMFDWEDTIVRVNGTNTSDPEHPTVLWAAGADGPQPNRNPRYV